MEVGVRGRERKYHFLSFEKLNLSCRASCSCCSERLVPNGVGRWRHLPSRWPCGHGRECHYLSPSALTAVWNFLCIQLGLLLPEYSFSQEQELLHYSLPWLLSDCPRKPLSHRPKPAKILLESPSVLLQSICLAETPSLRQFVASWRCRQWGCLSARDTHVHPEQNFLIHLLLQIEQMSEQCGVWGWVIKLWFPHAWNMARRLCMVQP